MLGETVDASVLVDGSIMLPVHVLRAAPLLRMRVLGRIHLRVHLCTHVPEERGHAGGRNASAKLTTSHRTVSNRRAKSSPWKKRFSEWDWRAWMMSESMR